MGRVNLEEILMRVRRAASERETKSALSALRKWLSTEEGTAFLLSVVSPPPARRGWFGRTVQEPVLPVSRIVVPLSLAPLGEARAALLGAEEGTLSPREVAMVDEQTLGWADWDPVRRVVTTADGLGIVVPEGVTLSQAAMATLGAASAVWPEMMTYEIEE